MDRLYFFLAKDWGLPGPALPINQKLIGMGSALSQEEIANPVVQGAQFQLN